MKKLLNIALVSALVIIMSTQIFAETKVVTDVKVVDSTTNEEINFENEIVNVDGTNFFPMRELLNNLGVSDENIEWNSTSKSVDFSSKYFDASFQIGNNNYSSNEVVQDIDVAPFIYNEKAYLPIRYVANSLGYFVEYDDETKTTILTSPKELFGIPETKDELVQLAPLIENEVLATFDTNYGQFTAKLFPEYAPLAVENFTTLSQDGYYDGLKFHRVIEDFVIQGGDPNGNGTGGESIYGGDFDNEVTGYLRHFNGALAMANSGPDTNGSQFYIVSSDNISDDYKQALINMKENPDGLSLGFQNEMLYSPVVVDAYLEYGGVPHLDFSYTVFGQIVDGMDIVEKINQVETNEENLPIEDVIINKITIKETK